MRLIDADKLIEALNLWGCYKHENPKAYDTLMLYEILGAIEDQPTAYDVGKVVEELGEATWQYNPPFNDEPYRMVILSNKAVQIVKRGGVE